MYLHDRRLHFVYNFVGTEITTVSAAVELPTGPVVARIVFTRAEGDRGGDVELFYGDVPVGSGHASRAPRCSPTARPASRSATSR